MKNCIIIIGIVLSISIIFTAEVRITSPQCQESYFWNGQTCIPCQSGCTCNTFQGCDTAGVKCVSNQTKSSTGCVNCPTGCNACEVDGTNGFKCSVCSDKYQLIKEICIKTNTTNQNSQSGRIDYTDSNNLIDYVGKKLLNCIKLNDHALCGECPSNAFFNEEGRCEQCPPNCSTCSARGTCTQCEKGYFWKYNQNNEIPDDGQGQGACTKCLGNGVDSCESDGKTPKTCLTSYFLNTANKPPTCDGCSLGCETCTSSSKCTKCESQFYLNQDVCTPCLGNTSTGAGLCESCSSGTKCDTCAEDAFLINNLCVACADQRKNCSQCKVEGQQLSCSVCNNKYYRVLANNIGTCSPCSESNANYLYCQKDDSGTSATVKPIQCISGSPDQISNNNYYLIDSDGGVCVQNNNLCYKMKDKTGVCSECISTMILIGDACKPCPQNCSKCDKNNTTPICSQCNDLFYPNSDKTQCQACADGCTKCDTTGKCSTCAIGYRLNSATCTKCTPAYCAECTDSICTKCMAQFFLYKKDSNSPQQCLLCPPGCLDCSSSNGQTCITCIPGYYKKGDGCFSGAYYCANLNDDGTCDECMYGARNVEGQCYRCISKESGYVCGQNAGATSCLSKMLNLVLIIFFIALSIY